MAEPAKPGTAMATYKPDDFKRPQSLAVVKAMGRMMTGAIADALPSFMRAQSQAILRAFYTECTKNPKLLEATPESLFLSVIAASQVGLQLGGILGQCYLVPFKGKVQLIIGYKGYIQLVNRSGQVGTLHAETVWEGDEYQVRKGSKPEIIHIPREPKDVNEAMKRKSIAFYATCMTKQGPVFQTMSRVEAEIHRSRFAMFKGDQGPWFQHFEAMAMKSCLLKLIKYLPMSAELQQTYTADMSSDAQDGFDPALLLGTDVNPIQFSGPAEEDKPDDRPHEEIEPENLPEPTKPATTKVEEKVKKNTGRGGKGGSMFGEGQQLPD